ncbi:MAG: iron-containing alcohol dehydrogenase PsrA [Hyphomicrobiaceae bacterium]
MWQYLNPVQVRFGTGIFQKVADLIVGRRYGLVTYNEPYFDELIRTLEQKAGSPVVTINDVRPNPDYILLDDQVARIAAAGTPDVWVALGGGSVIDSAKVFAAAHGAFSNVANFLEAGSGAENLSAVPIIAVPTTAGTGSEVTCWATVWKEETGQKFSLARSNLYPEFAVVDPALMIGKPLGLTISTGLDALSHALESIWNVNANPVSANLAVFAAREVMDVLPRLADDLTSVELRSRMAQASLFAGLAFSNTKTAISHSLSYPITLKHNVPHGIACSFSLPIVIESVKDIGGLCEASLRRIFDSDLEHASRSVATLLESCGVSIKPADHGVADQEWASLVDNAFEGERGRNFIGEKVQFLRAAETFGAAAPN